MIVYHGSYLEIPDPDLCHSRSTVDFGRGFYTTPLYEQAVKWCGRFVFARRKRLITTCILKEVSRYDRKPNFITEKIRPRHRALLSKSGNLPGRGPSVFLSTYRLVSEGVSDLHYMSDDYLADEFLQEYIRDLAR